MERTTQEVGINALLYAVRQAADVVCDRWALILIAAIMQGENRFGTLMDCTGMAKSLVTSRLRRLETLGMLVRVPYSIRPVRHEYMLTVMGREFFPVILQMARWEYKRTAPLKESYVGIKHVSCGQMLEPALSCSKCGEKTSARDIDIQINQAQLTTVPEKQSIQRRSTIDLASDPDGNRLLSASLRVFGDKWTVEIINCCFLRVKRFSEFRRWTGISSNILTDRLERLTAEGILNKDEHDSREYKLTEAGIDLYGILVALRDWSDDWIVDRYRSPLQLIHRSCKQLFHAQIRCECCNIEVTKLTDIEFVQREFFDLPID